MAVKKHIDRIVFEEIVLKMNTSVKVEYATPPAIDGGILKQNIRLCNMKWIGLYNFMYQDFAPGVSPKWLVDKEEYNGEDFKVTIPYTDGELFVGDVLRLELPYYISGTHRATNAELMRHQNNNEEVFPLIALSYSPAIKQKWFDDPSESLDRVADIKTVFACYADFGNDFTKEHLAKRITPLNGLVTEFVETIKRNPRFKSIGLTHDTVEFPRYGKESQEGVVSNILDATLSAIELRLSLPIYKGKHCEC